MAGAVREVMAAFPGKVDLLERHEKGGRGAAVIAAFKKGLADPLHFDYLFEMDADFSHHPREIGKFLRMLKTHDMVIGSRLVPGGGTSEWGFVRASLSWLANKYIAVVAGIPVKDATSGYRAYRRAVLEATDFDRIKIRGYVVHGEMAYQAWINGFRLGEVPIHFRNRRRAAFVCRSNGLEHLNYARMVDDHREGLRGKPWSRRVWYPLSRLTQVTAAARLADSLPSSK